MNDLMIDLETWARGPDAGIRAVGLAEFNPQTGYTERLALIDARTSMDDQIEAGRLVSASTMEWWRGKPALSSLINAHAEITQQVHTAFGIIKQVISFVLPMADAATGKLHGNVWARGSFDIAILRHLFDTFSVENQVPWAYWQERDVRTLDFLVDKVAAENPHDPLSDIAAQIQQVRAAAKLNDKTNNTHSSAAIELAAPNRMAS